MYSEWLLDVSANDTALCFCPIENGNVVVGMNFIGDKPPGKLVGVFSFKGEEECEKWLDENKDFYEELKKTDNLVQNAL